MIDTIGFKILIQRDIYEDLSKKTVVTQRIDKQTGDIEFEYHNTKINYSGNYKVQFKITDEYWDYDKTSRRPYIAKGIPQIVVEYSVPKILYDHNLISVDPSLIYESMHKVKESFEELFEVELPSPTEWFCPRIDTCANFILENESQVRRYIEYLQRLDYPRKPKLIFDNTGLYFSSRHNTLKIYCKGEEFKRNDMKRFTHKEALNLHEKAQRILRIEVEHKRRLRYLIENHEKENKIILKKFLRYVQMKDLIEIFHFQKEMERIVSKFFCGTETKIMKVVDVLPLLKTVLSDRQARSFHHIYMFIITQGQKAAKKQFPLRTYYRALSAFRKLGIPLIASALEKIEIGIDKGFPKDFSLDMTPENKYYQMPISAIRIK